jgi:hypothetical protein
MDKMEMKNEEKENGRGMYSQKTHPPSRRWMEYVSRNYE